MITRTTTMIARLTTILNPIIRSTHPDPSLCRVGVHSLGEPPALLMEGGQVRKKIKTGAKSSPQRELSFPGFES
jgi:hypothetical protein